MESHSYKIKYKFRFYIIIILLISFCVKKTNSIENNPSIHFDTPDVTKFVISSDEKIQLEAFKFVSNDEIINTNNASEYAKLMWVSLGNPTLVKTGSKQNKTVFKIFHFSDDGFYTHIQILTEKHQKLLLEAINQKHRIDVAHDQIFNLIPTSFKCSINSFFDKKKITIVGKVSDFRILPLRLQFSVNKNSVEVITFQKLLESKSDDSLDLSLECEIVYSKEFNTKVFTLTVEQINDLEIHQKLFGSLSSVYVTREQLNNLAVELYSVLDIEEEYEMSASEFSELFRNQLASLTGSSQLSQISFERVKTSLSNYSRDYDEFKADEINKDLSKLYEIKNINGKNFIHLNTNHLELLQDELKIVESTEGNSNSLVYLGFIKIDGCIKNAQDKLSDWIKTGKSIKEQLKDLNTEDENDIQWKIEGDRIVQKGLSVLRLNRNLFSKNIKFNKIRKESFNEIFKKKFTLYTIKSENDESNDNLNVEISSRTLNNKNLDESNWSQQLKDSIISELISLNANSTSLLEDKLTNITNEIVGIKQSLKILKRNSLIAQTLIDHDDYVNSLVVLPNSDLASASLDSTIKIWDINDGTLKKTLEGHYGYVYSLVILPNGDLASAGADNAIFIWNRNNGTVKKVLTGHDAWVRSLAVLPNGDLASASEDETIKIWSTSDGKLKKILAGHIAEVYSLTVLLNGDLVSGSADATIKIWNSNDGILKKTLRGHTKAVWTLAVLSNGDLVSGSDDNSIKIWNTNTGSTKKTLNGHSSTVRSLAILPKGDLASGSGDATIKIWNTNDGTVKKTLNGHAYPVRSLVVLPNGNLASGSEDRSIIIWALNQG